MRHNAVGKPRAVGRCLQPLGLGDRVRAADGGLHVHRLGDIRVAGLGDVVFGKIVPLGEPLYLPSQGLMRYAGLPVAVDQLRVLHIVEMDVRIDELQLVHEQVSSVPGPLGAARSFFVILDSHPSFPRKREPIFAARALDSGFRRNDGQGLTRLFFCSLVWLGQGHDDSRESGNDGGGTFVLTLMKD